MATAMMAVPKRMPITVYCYSALSIKSKIEEVPTLNATGETRGVFSAMFAGVLLSILCRVDGC